MNSKYLWVLLVSNFLLLSAFIYCIVNLDNLSTITILIACLIFGIAIIANLLVIIASNRKKEQINTKVTESTYNDMQKECDEVVYLYLRTLNKRQSCRNRTIYEKPWFLIYSSENGCVSTILESSGLDFYFQYPIENSFDNHTDQIVWRFSEEAVWIEIPRSIIEANCKERWIAFIEALINIRKKRPVDGIVLVIDTMNVIKSESSDISKFGVIFRNKIDELIVKSGLVVPIYLISNNVNEVPGFQEFISEERTQVGKQIFGFTLKKTDFSEKQLTIYTQEFDRLLRLMSSLQIEKLNRERNESKKRLICQFVLNFFCIQQKMETLIEELCGINHYDTRPFFRGLYFTACFEVEFAQEHTASSKCTSIVKYQQSHLKLELVKKNMCSMFLLPLFREVLAKEKLEKIKTPMRYQKEIKKKLKIILLFSTAVFVIATLMALLHFRVRNILDEIETEINSIGKPGIEFPETFKTFEIYQKRLIYLQKCKDERTLFKLFFEIHKGDELLNVIKRKEFELLKRLLVIPTAKYLEFELKKIGQKERALSIREYEMLYETLKVYLLLSEKKTSKFESDDLKILYKALPEKSINAIIKSNTSSFMTKNMEMRISQSIGLYIKYLSNGEFPTIKVNQKIVSYAQKMLVQFPSAELLYRNMIEKIKARSPNITLQQLLKSEDLILKTNKTISSVYTKNGFKDVLNGINVTAKNPYKVDWVIGCESEELNKAIESDNIQKKMLDAYICDFKEQWLHFISSVCIDPFRDITQASQILQKLASNESQIASLFLNISDVSHLNIENDQFEDATDALKSAISMKVKKTIGEKIEKYQKKPQYINSEIEKVNSFFKHFSLFVLPDNGADNYFSVYKDSINQLINTINEIQVKGEYCAPTLFNGKESDPLCQCYRTTEKILNILPDQISASVRDVLTKPYEYTGKVISTIMSRAINKQWESEVVSYYKNQLSDRYPFNPRGDDASIDEVKDYFRPKTGIYWDFYERMLSGYISKTKSGWGLKGSNFIALNFNQEIFISLRSVEKVTETLFKSDGTSKIVKINLIPDVSNDHKGFVLLGEKCYELEYNKRSNQILWPDETINVAGLRISTGEKKFQDISFYGPWSIMKLMRAGELEMVNNRSYSLRWQFNVSGMYTIFYKVRINLSSEKNPFNETIFEQVNCPANLIQAAIGATD